ncbi:MAG: hypothetical protein ACW98X_26820 [Promethearchaeota archaeon]|jgi:hypothetical protein
MTKYIIDNLIKLMENAEVLSDLKSGQAKKEYVMNELRNIIDLPAHVEYLIMEVIDILIEVDKGNIRFNKKVKNGCLKYIKNIC